MDTGPFCLVLSGGGAKGVYHLGVWRALQELGVEVEAFVGTSIGALVAAYLAQGADRALADLIRTIGPSSILELPPGLGADGEWRLDRQTLPAVRDWVGNLIAKRGLDTGPLRRLLAETLDEAALRASGLDLGLVTVGLADLSPRELFLDQIEAGRLVDYLMASSAFPGFELPQIDGRRYLDGGLHDNIPFALARRRGYRRLIVSDISGAGRNRKIEVEGTTTVYIRNSIRMGGVLDFDRTFLDEFQTLGYLDTLRAIGRLDGWSYFVRPDPGFWTRLGPADEGPPLPPAVALDPRRALARLEAAARAVETPRIALHTPASLAAEVEARRRAEEGRARALASGAEGPQALAALAALVRGEVTTRSFRGGPYFTWCLIGCLFPGSAGRALRNRLRALFPDLALALDWFERRAQQADPSPLLLDQYERSTRVD